MRAQIPAAIQCSTQQAQKSRKHASISRKPASLGLKLHPRHGAILEDAFNYAKHLLAGALSAVVSRTCCAPMETVKMQMIFNHRSGSTMQVAADVLREEGVAGFWRGNGINILRTAPYKAVNFFCFDMYRKAFLRAVGPELRNEAKVAAGALAGITATLCCFPLDVLRTRVLSTSNSHARGSPLAMLVNIAHREGISALYVGVAPALVAMVPSGAVYYWLYDALKEQHLNHVSTVTGRKASRLDAAHSLMYGALAGAAAESTVYPLEVIRRRMQQSAAAAVASANGAPIPRAAANQASLKAFTHAAREIWVKEGLSGFFAGIAPNTIQVLPSAALGYFAFETFKSLLRVRE